MKQAFVDAHHHLWNLDKLDYGWLKRIGEMKPFGDPTPIQRNYEFPELKQQDAAELPLIKSVHLQCDPSIPDPVTETAYISQQAETHNHPIAIVGFVDLSSDKYEETILSHKTYSRFRGIRQIVCKTVQRPDLCFVQSDLMLSDKWQQAYASLEKRDLSFDLQLYPEQMETAANLITDHPNIPVAVNHAGCPFDLSSAGVVHWRQELTKLAKLDNVFLKFSGLGMYDPKWDATSAQELFKTVLDLFGADRLMLGSNFPVDKLMRSYKDIWCDYDTWISDLTSADQQAICRTNAENFYRF
ncbi:MAG: amidohydrolase family protein [Alphaproteobacteria bacterium]